MGFFDELKLDPGVYGFNDLKPGDWYNTGAIVVSESHLINFAGISGDFFDIHMDPIFAKNNGYKDRIAHGLLVLSLIDGLKNRAPVSLKAIASLEWNEWQFIAPVYIGDRILAKITIKDLRVTSNSARGVVSLMFEVINQNDEVVQKGCNHLLVQR